MTSQKTIEPELEKDHAKKVSNNVNPTPKSSQQYQEPIKLKTKKCNKTEGGHLNIETKNIPTSNKNCQIKTNKIRTLENLKSPNKNTNEQKQTNQVKNYQNLKTYGQERLKQIENTENHETKDETNTRSN